MSIVDTIVIFYFVTVIFN